MRFGANKFFNKILSSVGIFDLTLLYLFGDGGDLTHGLLS